MQITHLLSEQELRRRARLQVQQDGCILTRTASELAAHGVDVGALERRLLDNVEAA